jgi:hypothetical protein
MFALAALLPAFFICILAYPQAIGDDWQAHNRIGLGIDKYKDLYLLDSSTSRVLHFDSETGIYLGDYINASQINAQSLTDISVCSCGGAIALLDQKANTLKVMDFEGNNLWDKELHSQELKVLENSALNIGLCQDSDYEHVIISTTDSRLVHIAPEGQPSKPFQPSTKYEPKAPKGVYMDFIKQVFICDSGNGRIIKTGEYGDFKGEFGKGILSNPVDVATTEDNERHIWVADQNAKKLFVFSEDFNLLFDCGEGILKNPTTVVCDYIDSGCFVAEEVEGKINIFKFDKNGKLVLSLSDATVKPIQKVISCTAGSYVLYVRGGDNRKLANPIKLQDEKDFMVEVRPVAEISGYTVTWNQQSRTASFSKSGSSVTIDVATSSATSNGKKIEINPNSFISKQKLLVPGVAIEELFDISMVKNLNTVFFISPKLTEGQVLPKVDEGKELFSQKCNKCHTAPAPDTKTRNLWPPIVKRMALKLPAWISDAEADKIIQYLWGQAKPSN